MSPIFVLVHGTFARNAQWARAGSLLRQKLKSRFGNAAIVSYRWSGWNSHKARATAALKLAERLGRIQQQERPIFVIAHSHGGNIAVSALRHIDDVRNIIGVVCISTPFISVSRRDYSIKLWIILAISSAIALFTYELIYFVFLYRVLGVPDHGDGLWIVHYGGLWVGPMLFVYWKFDEKILKAITKYLDHKWGEVSCRFKHSKMSVPLLCARVRGDEAKSWLRLGYHASEIPGRIFILWFISAVISILTAAIFAGLFVALVAFRESRFLPLLGRASSILDVAMIGVSVFPFVCIGIPLLALAPLLMRGGPWMFGGERLWDNIVAHINVSSMPDASVSNAEELVVQVGFRVGRHGALYNYPTFLEQMCEFIASALSRR
jgi:hypothetical protein